MADTPAPDYSVRNLAKGSIPALLIGVISALILFSVEWVAGQLQHLVWDVVPGAVGVAPDNGWWIIGTLGCTGLAVGLVVRLAPGHGGNDSAATELEAPVLKLSALPSLIAVTILALAGGVSLGPENPIIAINTAVLTAVAAKLFTRMPARLIEALTLAGTISALFGTPVAAALLFTGMAGLQSGGALFDRLFLPLAAAGAGALTAAAVGGVHLGVPVPPMPAPDVQDLVAAAVVASAAAAFGLIGAVLLPPVHRFFHGMKNPILFTTLGGLVLGCLGVIGGPVTLFKGATESAELVADRSADTPGMLFLTAVIKILAVVVAAAAGFRGGRIFPAVFIGVSLGLSAAGLVPGLPVSLAVAAGVLGVVLAIARDGWLALFVAVAVTGDVGVLPLLVIAILPAWLVVTNAPEMLAKPAK